MDQVLGELWRLVGYSLGQSTEWWKAKEQDFLVIWTASFCVEIRCQETTSEDYES
jgi:hypothetical protein